MSGKSRIEKILENLLGENNVIEPPIGRDEKILYSILNDLEYTEPPHSIFEELLLAIKNSSPLETEYAYDYLTRDEKILFCKLNRLEYFEPPHSRLEKLLIKWLYLDLYLNIDGVPPFTFISNGSPLIDYLISGNTVQNGTPTHDNPAMPKGTGERTGNLFDGSIEQGTLNENAAIGTSYNNTKSIPTAAINPYRVRVTNLIYIDRELTVSIDFNSYQMYVLFFDENQKYTGSHSSSWRNTPLTLSGEYIGKYIGLIVKSKQSGNVPISSTDDVKLMLNTGSTALPYEPYGYKLDISSANTTTPVYLGEVETTRKIKKLVLTGDETLTSGSVIGQIRTPLTGAINSLGLCTHYIIKTSYGGAFPYFRIANNVLWFELSPDGYETKEEALADFKAYLAQQYAAGTPVTLWYVLAKPETGIVNEPLMKIGDYADSINYEQTVVSIPTVNGRNTFDVLGDVKPSNVEITYAPRAPLLRTRKTILKK